MKIDVDKTDDLQIEYSKGKEFNPSLATGVYGGITGVGKICMNFYVDRIPIPDKVSVKVEPDGRLIETEIGKKNIISIREVHSCIIMDIDMAKSFYEWLGSKISDFSQAQEKAKPK